MGGEAEEQLIKFRRQKVEFKSLPRTRPQYHGSIVIPLRNASADTRLLARYPVRLEENL